MKAPVLLLFLLLAKGVFTDIVKSVMEGDSVTLHTDLTDLQKYERIVWVFGLGHTRIAQINTVVNKISVYNDVLDGKSRDRLQLDDLTGSLTITDTKTEDSGLYELQTIGGKEVPPKTFSVIVSGPLPIPVITRNSSQCPSSSSYCSVVCSVVNVGHVTLSWYKGNSLLSSISVSDLSISLSLPLEVEYQEKNSYSCVINNPIRNQTTHLDISKLCQPCSAQGLSVGVIAGICVGLLLVAGGPGVYCCYKKFAKGNDQTTTHQAIPLENDPVSSTAPCLPRRDTNNPNNGQALLEVANNPNNANKEIPDQEKDLPDGPEESGPLIDDEEILDQGRDLPGGLEESDPLHDMFHSEPDQVKKIKVKQGDTVTLKSGVTEIQIHDRLRWKYADSRASESTTLYSVIAVYDKRSDKIFEREGPGGKFKDRLQLDHQTGNLTIKNMRVKDSGLFKLEIKSDTNPLTKTIKVNVRVPTKMVLDDPNDTLLSLIPEEDPNDTSTYSVESGI
ncbi:uncharacterized protein zgc:171601 isoform X1 [Carassius gibelio]|uniref:uncharacterized protein zgc:171601 isoform X1 n=1 Tax=Carassius gibelio TaxID=101364 RepID=UPI002277D446|nr:uncharacterized protein zgc:171601 isoform X1 [Carassius gibelio]